MASRCGPGGEWVSRFDPWLSELLGDERDIALIAVGSYGRGDAAPHSDLDLVLLHRGRPGVEAVAERLWYPIWDRGLALDHSVRTVNEALAVADADLKAMLGMLDARLVAGDAALAGELAAAARAAWRGRAKRWLRVLRDAVEERHEKFGEVAYLLEPEIKEGRGGLRDVHALRAAALATPVLHGRLGPATRPTVDSSRSAPPLHTCAGRRLDRLQLQEQDGVAAELGLADADALMANVSAAARAISYVSDDAWDRIDAWLGGPRARAERVILPHDPGQWLAAAAEAADTGVPLSPAALAAVRRVGRRRRARPCGREQWRDDLVSLLGAGHDAIPCSSPSTNTASSPASCPSGRRCATSRSATPTTASPSTGTCGKRPPTLPPSPARFDDPTCCSSARSSTTSARGTRETTPTPVSRWSARVASTTRIRPRRRRCPPTDGAPPPASARRRHPTRSRRSGDHRPGGRPGRRRRHPRTAGRTDRGRLVGHWGLGVVRLEGGARRRVGGARTAPAVGRRWRLRRRC